MQDVREKRNLPVPKHLRNAPTKLMKNEGYGRGYAYDPSDPEGGLLQDHLPENLIGTRYYFPADSGIERELGKRLEDWLRRRAAARAKETT
jgi:putative ATPase